MHLQSLRKRVVYARYLRTLTHLQVVLMVEGRHVLDVAVGAHALAWLGELGLD